MDGRLGYIAQCMTERRPIKIGQSRNPYERVRQLQTNNPLPIKLVAVLRDGPGLETELKSLLAPWKLEGEWFLPSCELQAWLDAAVTGRRVLNRVAVNAEFVTEHIAPLLKEYLGGRQPTNTGAGDLACRVLAGMLDDPRLRARELHSATKGRIPYELCLGYLTSTERPIIVIPGESLAAETAEQEAAA